jgi:succinyl-diaminopimelate desuccinylase
MDVLQLDVSGRPQAWISPREAAILYASDAIAWTLGGSPFLTRPGTLSAALTAAIQAETGATPVLSTTGGTSDGRFIAPTGAQVVEIGPCNATIHKIDERVAVSDLETLTDVYERLLEKLLA